MNKTVKLACCIAAAGAVTLSACKKKDSTPTAHDKLVGKWVSTYEVLDSNGNNVMDTNEYSTLSSTIYFTFKGDGTGSDITAGGASADTFLWTLTSNNTNLHLVLLNSSGNDTADLKITTLTSTDLTLADSSELSSGALVTDWLLFKKQ